jgi:nucleoside 2-deoxyribosyltransferase
VESARSEINACDALLIDISDNPGGGRVTETGIAYALNKPIFVIVKRETPYKEVIYDGVAERVIRYNNYTDVTKALTEISLLN